MSEIDISEEAVEHLARRIHTREPYKSAVQLMVEDLAPESPTIALGQGDYPTAAQIADRATSDMNSAAISLRALRSALTAAEAERDKALAQVAALREALEGMANVWASVCRANGWDPCHMQQYVGASEVFSGTAAAAREYRARVVEECADIAAEQSVAWTDHSSSPVSSVEMRDIMQERSFACKMTAGAIRTHAAKVREGKE